MIINSGSYGSSLKQKGHTRDYLKKKKSQEAFYIKAKLNSQLGEQLKYLNARKSQARVSTSMGEINPKEDPRRLSSIEVADLDTLIPKPASKQKKNMGHCWSERNVTLQADPAKMQKYRKFSSNAELPEGQPRLESQRRKLSLVDEPTPARKLDRLGLMAWLILIRKLFAEEFRRRSSKTVKLPVLYSYIQKLDGEGLQEFALIVEPLEYELDLSKAQVITVLETYFEGLRKARPGKTEAGGGRASFSEVMGCLAQFQSKNSNIGRVQANSASSEQEAVETARFQQGGEQVKKRKLSEKKSQLNSLVPKMQTHKYIRQNGKENAITSNIPPDSLFKSPSACAKTRQSLNPSHSPLTNNDSRSIQNSRALLDRDESEPLTLKRGVEQQGSQSELLGMLSIQGKSPRELMVSQIYESIQREGFVHQNNVSFSLEHLQPDSRLTFQHTVHSFQEILRKIRSIQNSYKSKVYRQEEKSEQEVNLFLQQLINYRIASSRDGSEEDYSYLASFQDLTEVREHNRGIMLALLQSTYLKEYFMALEGLKVKNSFPFLKNITHLLHPTLRIINFSYNSLSSANFLADSLPSDNALEFLNLNHNFIPDLSSLLRKCPRLREIHCHSNLISEVKDTCVASQDLRIIDLSSNKLEEQSDLSGLVGVGSLMIVNLLNNPLTQGTNWKGQWSGSINLNLICMMDNLYVMSSYGHQKDITFTLQKTPPKNQRDRYNSTELIHEFSISDMNRSNEPPRFGKQTPKTDSHLNSSKSFSKPQEPPKQKISKIKAFIDGKVI